jgi:hypothetical protein
MIGITGRTPERKTGETELYRIPKPDTPSDSEKAKKGITKKWQKAMVT